MKTFSQFGAMYAEIEEGDRIEPVPVELGDGILSPGEYIRKLGHKARTSFEMKEGHYLRYLGMGREGQSAILLFAVDRYEAGRYCYAFNYVDRNTLVIGGRSGCRDIVVRRLEKFTEPPGVKETVEQPTLWEVAEG